MNVTDWLQIITPILTVLSTCFSAWLLAKYGRTQGAIDTLHKKTEEVLKQNETQEKKLDTVHEDINGRVAEYVRQAVKAALAEGLAQGIEQERQRNEAKK